MPEALLKNVRVKLSTSMVGPKVSWKAGEIITVDAEEAKRHVENGNGSIVVGPDEETENQRMRVELAQLRAALAAKDAVAAPVKK